MEQFLVTGMSCAACSARIEKAVGAVPGVTNCSVSLLTNSMGVEGSASAKDIISAVEKAGYGASVKNQITSGTGLTDKGLADANNEDGASNDNIFEKETALLKKRLIASLCILIPLMYVSMGHMMWHFPVPQIFQQNIVLIGIYELLLSGLVMVINQKFFISGFKGLMHKAPNMDTLVALGATASFVYSVFALGAVSQGVYLQDDSMITKYSHEFYFESAAMILTLITVGKMLEAKSKGKTTDALKGLMKLAPKTATLISKDDQKTEKIVPIKQVKIDDLFAVKPGETIPVDGIVIDGNSAVDEAFLTGESIPVDKTINDQVYAASMNQSGYLVCKATRVGEDTTLSQIIKMVSDVSATKAPIAKIADKVSGIFVPTVMTISFITFLAWLFLGKEFGFALTRAISVLVISCPCALGLATPVAIMVGNGVGAKNGVLFKTAESLEETGRATIVVMDKTGTITKGEPKVTKIVPAENFNKEKLLNFAFALEKRSEHPLAKAVVEEAQKLATSNQFKLTETIDDFEVMAGNGLKGVIEGKVFAGGNYNFISQIAKMDSSIISEVEQHSKKGNTPLYFSYDDVLCGVILVADSVKEDSIEAIKRLKEMGIHTVMLTGDNEVTAKSIGETVKVDQIIAGVLPEGKAKVIEELKAKGKVIMVGDGINDAPALTCADIGIAIGAGTDVAIDAADVVLMKNSIMDVVMAIQISKRTLQIIHENLFWAFFYNVIGIPLAAGVFTPIFGWTLKPMFGAAAMSLSSFCVVTNALRLNLIQFKQQSKINNKNITKTKETKKEKENLEMEVLVKGMMCPHCEAHVKKALESIDGITLATPDHKEGVVKIETSKEVSMDEIKTAITDAGYEFQGEK